MEDASIEKRPNAQNPKLALLQKIKQQKEADAALICGAQKTKPKSSNDQGAAPRNIQSKKKHGQSSKRTNDLATSGIPSFSGAFLDEFEKSVKITRLSSSQRKSSSRNLNDEEISKSNITDKINAEFEGIPTAISINDIKTYMTNLCKPTSQITHDQKIYYLDHRLLLIQEISNSLSRHLLTGRHMYGSGIINRMAEKKVDIYETTLLLLEEFRLCPDQQKIRPLLLAFLTFFTNVLVSKDVGMTTYVIEQSAKAGIFQPLLDLSTGWTIQEENNSQSSLSKNCFPSEVTLRMEEHLKDIEDQLTGTWKPLTRPEDSTNILPVLERCLRSSVRFHGLHTGVVNELCVSDWMEAGVQQDGSEGQVRPLSIALAHKFPGYIDKYRICDDECEGNIDVTTTSNKNKNSSAGGNGLISFHRLFPTGHALVSLGMRRKKYLEKLEGISEAIAEVFDDSNSSVTDFGTLASYMHSSDCTSSGEEDIDNSPNRNSGIGSACNVKKQKGLTENETKVTTPKYTYSSKNMFIVMTEDLTFDSKNVENKLNVPKFLTQVDFLRAVMLKPKDINETYRGLTERVNIKRRAVETAYVYLVDVGLLAHTKITSLLVIQKRRILQQQPLLSFVKIKGLDPSLDFEVANACARVIYHIVDDQESQRHMMKHVIMNEVTTKSNAPDISKWRRMLVEKEYPLGLQSLSIKAFRSISHEHHNKNCTNVEDMPVNDSSFHTDMCKYTADFIWDLLLPEKASNRYEAITQEKSIIDAMHTLYYTMDIMPEARLKRTLQETKVIRVVQTILGLLSYASDTNEAENLSELVTRLEDVNISVKPLRHLDEVVLSLAEKINGFDIGGNAHMRRLTNQRLTNCYPQGFRRRGGDQGGVNLNEVARISPSIGRGIGRGYYRGHTGMREGSKRRPPPTESEGGPINTGGGIVPNSRSQAHQLAIKAGIPGFNQPVYRSKADIDPDVRHSTVGQAGVTTKAIAFRSSEDKYLESLENAAGNTNISVTLKEKSPLADRAKELESNSRRQQEEEPIDYESLIQYADIADFADPENVVALPDMKSSRRLKQEIVALLNENRGGQLLLGVDERSNGGAGLVNGVFLNRWLKDKFRQEMDGIPKQIAPDPLPDRRIGQPVFIPVRYNPRVNSRNGETPYVIRIAIRPKIKELTPEGGDITSENQIYFKLRDEPNPMIRLHGKTIEGIYLNIQKKILQMKN